MMGLICLVMCLWDNRREECVIVSHEVFKEINIVLSLFGLRQMGMSVLVHLFCWILSGGEDIVLFTLLKERDRNFSFFGVATRFILQV